MWVWVKLTTDRLTGEKAQVLLIYICTAVHRKANIKESIVYIYPQGLIYSFNKGERICPSRDDTFLGSNHEIHGRTNGG